jgi:hypothetical protein
LFVLAALFALSALGALALPAPAAAGGAAGAAGESGLAIKGYDPVAYFIEGHPLMGSESFEYQWKGAKWRFLDAGNRDQFAAHPERYAPQYGGYSAYAVSSGELAAADPTVFSIVDEKLYLNGSRETRELWLRAMPSYISSANRHWPELESGLGK